MKYKLEIKPAILPGQRHKIEDVLKEMGYEVWAGGGHTDGSACDIAFETRKRKVLEPPFEPDSFTKEECQKAVEKVFERKDPTEEKVKTGVKWPADWIPLSDPDEYKAWIEDNKTC